MAEGGRAYIMPLPLRVLYVDDEPDLLSIAKRFLKRQRDVDVDTLTSAREALELLGRERYDAIISDYQMPEMDGITFLKQLKASGDTTPFIIFTGRGREEIVIEALNSGADFYLQKGGEPKAQFTELAHMICSAVDRKRTEQLAKDTERRLYDIINFLPDATFAIDIQGHVIAWNKAIEEMTGIAAHDMLGKGNYEYSIPFYGERRPILIDLVSVPDEELSYDTYTRIKKEGENLIAETMLSHAPGKDSVLNIKTSRLYNDDGTVIGAIASIRDVTEQKRADEKIQKKSTELLASYEQIAAGEEELRANLDELARQGQMLQERETQLRATLESTADGILAVDKFGKILHASRRFAEIWHVPDSIMESDNDSALLDFVLDQLIDPEAFLAKVKSLYESDAVDMDILTFKDDRVIERYSFPMILDGHRFGRVWSFRDITGRKRAEEALEESKTRLETMTNNIPGVVYRFFVNPDGTTGFDYISKRSAEVLGLDNDVGTFLDRFIDGLAIKDQERFLRTIQHAIRTKTLWEFESEYVHPSGKKIWISVLSSPSIEHDRLIFDGVTFDNTGKKRVEEELLRKNEELNVSYEQNAAGEEELRANLDELVQQERALRESEDKYHTVADFTSDWEFWIAPDRKFIYVSPSCERITGYRPDEFMGNPDLLAAIAHHDDRDLIMDHLSSQQKSFGERVSLEFRIITRSGEERWISHESQPVYGPNGEYRGSRGSNRDITERKHAEETVVASLKRTRDQQAALATLTLSPSLLSGDVDSFSSGLTEMASDVLGVERASVWLFSNIGDELRCIDLYEKSHDRHSANQELKRSEYEKEFDALSKAQYIDAHDPLTDPRTAGYGEGYLVPNHITSMLDAVIRVSGHNLGVICFEHVNLTHQWESDEIAFACQLADQVSITLLNRDRKQAEAALRESEERYHHVVEDQTEFICRFLPDGTHIFVNDAYCRYFNKKKEEIIGHLFKPVIHPLDRELVARHLTALTPGQPHGTVDQRIIMPDSSTRWQQWSDRAIFDKTGRLVEYQSVGRDITDQKDLEREREDYTQKLTKYSTSLDAANKKLTLLSSITRHDINNQLTVLQGYLSILESDQPDPAFHEYLRKVLAAAERISAMIQFTKEYEAIGVMAPTWQNTRKLIDTAATEAPLGTIRVSNEIPAGTEVLADPLIAKVIYNLMDNAARYGEKVKTIRFSVEEQDDDRLIICEDDGKGVRAEEKVKIFDRGFGKNTGLGLSLSREILTITGITITENGEPGKGARFEMVVPKGTWRTKREECQVTPAGTQE